MEHFLLVLHFPSFSLFLSFCQSAAVICSAVQTCRLIKESGVLEARDKLDVCGRQDDKRRQGNRAVIKDSIELGEDCISVVLSSSLPGGLSLHFIFSSKFRGFFVANKAIESGTVHVFVLQNRTLKFVIRRKMWLYL